MDQSCLTLVIVKKIIHHIIVFSDIECIFRKSGIFSYLILFIIEDDLFVMGKGFMRFRFKTNDNLPYNKKINVPVCVISISSVFEERNWYYPWDELQECFYESDYFDKD